MNRILRASEVSAITAVANSSMFELREVFHQMCQPMTTLLWMLELAEMKEHDILKRSVLKDALSECQRLVDGIDTAQGILVRDFIVVNPKKKISWLR